MSPVDLALLTFTCDAWSQLFSPILVNILPWHDPLPLDNTSLDVVTWWSDNVRPPFQDEIVVMAEKGCISVMKYIEDRNIFWNFDRCLIVAARGMNEAVVSFLIIRSK